MRRVILVSLAVAASLAVPAAATAASGWSKPATLLPAGKLVYQPAIATAANGTTVVVWTQYDSLKNTYTLMSATRAASGKTAMRKLGPAVNALAKPALAVGGDGTFAVAWEYPGRHAGQDPLAVRIMPRGAKVFGSTTKVSPANLSTDYGAGDTPSVAVDDSGTVFVAWEGLYSSGGRHSQVVETQRAHGSRTWSSPVRLSASGVDSHGGRIAADGKGRAAVSWAETNSSVWASVTSSGGHFGAAKKISGVTFESSPASIAISDKGKSSILWEQSGKKNTHRIASKVTSSSTFPSKTQFLSGKALARYQALAIASNGTGVAAWEAEVSGGWEIDAASLGGSSWGHSTQLNPTGYVATFGLAPVVAANNKRAVVAWSEKDLHHASFVGVRVRVGNSWQKAANFPGLSAPVVSVANDPVKSGRVAGAMVWLSITGVQISILKP